MKYKATHGVNHNPNFLYPKLLPYYRYYFLPIYKIILTLRYIPYKARMTEKRCKESPLWARLDYSCISSLCGVTETVVWG